jgi:HEAT repeat protein
MASRKRTKGSGRLGAFVRVERRDVVDPLHRLFGPPHILELRAKSDIAGLVRALKRKRDAKTRVAAASALGETRDPQGVMPLVAALHDAVPAVGMAAAVALGRIGDRRAVEPLLDALGGEPVELHNSVVAALDEIGVPRAAEGLVAALGDVDPVVRRSAAEALGRIGAANVIEPLVASLIKDEDVSVRRRASI